MEAQSHLLDKRLRLAATLTVTILVAELVGGYLANSLALLSDAGHVFTDLLALGLSWYGLKQAERPATERMTYGYHRIGILIAVINALTLLAIAGLIFYGAAQRFQKPEPVQGGLMFGVALVGLAVNLAVAFLLRRDQEHSLNVKSAFWHVLGDALSSIGVIVAGVIILLSGWFWVDPAVSVLIGAVIGVGAWRILQEGVVVFLEASPRHLHPREVVEAMTGVLGVKDVHDLHIWSITPQMHALSCHVLVDDQAVSQGAPLLQQLNQLLSQRFAIHHTTIQLECEGCQPGALYCTLYQSAANTSHRHS